MTDAATALPDRLEELPNLQLDSGGHTSFKEGHCAMELVAYLAGEEHTDRPACTSPVLTSFLIRLNEPAVRVTCSSGCRKDSIHRIQIPTTCSQLDA